VWTFLGSKNRPCSIRMRTEQPKIGKHSNIKCGHGGWSVGRSDPYADICGHLLAKSIFTNETKAKFFFVDHLLNHRALCHHISILYCSLPPHIGARYPSPMPGCPLPRPRSSPTKYESEGCWSTIIGARALIDL
jgi:hypothetical protein